MTRWVSFPARRYKLAPDPNCLRIMRSKYRAKFSPSLASLQNQWRGSSIDALTVTMGLCSGVWLEDKTPAMRPRPSYGLSAYMPHKSVSVCVRERGGLCWWWGEEINVIFKHVRGSGRSKMDRRRLNSHWHHDTTPCQPRGAPRCACLLPVKQPWSQGSEGP